MAKMQQLLLCEKVATRKAVFPKAKLVDGKTLYATWPYQSLRHFGEWQVGAKDVVQPVVPIASRFPLVIIRRIGALSYVYDFW